MVKAGSQSPRAKKILVAVDGSSVSIRGVEHAVRMAKEKNADLIALFVDTTIEDMSARYGTYPMLRDVKDVSAELDIKSIENSEVVDVLEKHYKCAIKPLSVIRGESGLEAAKFLAEKQGVKIDVMVERGRAAETIVTVAKEKNVDMIVIGSHGWRGFQRIQLGSVADQVSKLAWCPVLIVKPESVA